MGGVAVGGTKRWWWSRAGVGDGSDGGASLLVVLPHCPRCLVVDEGCVAALAVARMASSTLSPC